MQIGKTDENHSSDSAGYDISVFYTTSGQRHVVYCDSTLRDNFVNFDLRIRRICFLFNFFIIIFNFSIKCSAG